MNAQTMIYVTPKGERGRYQLGTLWAYRDVLIRLVLREFQVRYRQTALGIFWIWLQPTLAMAIFTLMLGRLAGVYSEGLPYSVFALTGLVLWFYFSNCILHGSNVFVDNRGLIKQAYFPRIFLPLAIVLSKLIDLVIGFFLLTLWCMVVFPFRFSDRLLLLFPSILGIFLLGFGIILFFSTLSVRFRDTRYVIPFISQILFFATPIVYSMELAKPDQRWIFLLNPLAIFVQSVRDALFNLNVVSNDMFLLSFFNAVIIFLIGLWFYRAKEKIFADIV